MRCDLNIFLKLIKLGQCGSFRGPQDGSDLRGGLIRPASECQKPEKNIIEKEQI